MSDEKLEQPQDLKCTSRRSRKDEQGRDYVCGCGKRYLSYPALYTHIKTKHDGHQPQGTQKSGLSQTSNRKTKPKLDDRVLKSILNLVTIDNLKILNQLNQNAHGYVTIPHRIKKQHLCKQIIQAFQNLLKINSLILDHHSSLDTILVCYLLAVGQFICQSLFQYYQHFAKLFRNCFYQYGKQVYTNYFYQNDSRKTKSINIQQCKLSPIICDLFIRYYIISQGSQAQNFKQIMQLICIDFCEWMFIHKYTIVEIEMNYPYTQEIKNIIFIKNKKYQQDKSYDKYQKYYSQQHHSSINQSPQIKLLQEINKSQDIHHKNNQHKNVMERTSNSVQT